MNVDDKTIKFALLAMKAAQENRQKQLDQMSYTEYLKTPEWQAKKKKVRTKASNRCERCFIRIDQSKLDTHHKRYPRRGQEVDEDLAVLCDRCHRKEHGIK